MAETELAKKSSDTEEFELTGILLAHEETELSVGITVSGLFKLIERKPYNYPETDDNGYLIPGDKEEGKYEIIEERDIRIVDSTHLGWGQEDESSRQALKSLNRPLALIINRLRGDLC